MFSPVYAGTFFIKISVPPACRLIELQIPFFSRTDSGRRVFLDYVGTFLKNRSLLLLFGHLFGFLNASLSDRLGEMPLKRALFRKSKKGHFLFCGENGRFSLFFIMPISGRPKNPVSTRTIGGGMVFGIFGSELPLFFS
jgi:hypothetical protein